MALTQLAGDRSAEKAWKAKETIERAISVATAAGTVEVIIRSPADGPGAARVGEQRAQDVPVGADPGVHHAADARGGAHFAGDDLLGEGVHESGS